MHYKVLNENYIRSSGLDYLIIRPPQLVGGFDDNKLT